MMAATVLNSPEAIQMSVFGVRAFIKMREALISRSELERRLHQRENVRRYSQAFANNTIPNRNHA